MGGPGVSSGSVTGLVYAWCSMEIMVDGLARFCWWVAR